MQIKKSLIFGQMVTIKLSAFRMKNKYPFAGYKKVLGFIFQTIMKTENANFWILGSGQIH